jgi:erythromycin esterase-like protein
MLPTATLDDLRLAVQPLADGEAGDYDPLLKLMRDARVVLLGVASVGTHELFSARAQLTKRLIQEKGFTSLAVPTTSVVAEHIDRFVKARSDGELVSDALIELTEFPRWLWRNAEMLDFLGWLRNFNDAFEADSHKVSVSAVGVEHPPNTVVWEHSRRVGDGRASDHTESSLGQHARDRWGPRAALVTFTTFSGSVVAAREATQAPFRQQLGRPLADSVEAMCHALELQSFVLPIRGAADRLAAWLREPRPERMVDAVYRADTNDPAEHVRARLADQFDALVYFDETRSLEPIDPR